MDRWLAVAILFLGAGVGALLSRIWHLTEGKPLSREKIANHRKDLNDAESCRSEKDVDHVGHPDLLGGHRRNRPAR